MSTKKPLLTIGLTALGLSSGTVAFRAADSGPSAPPGPSASAAASAAPAPAVLLMSDGRVLQGFVSEDQDGYVLKQRGGQLHFRKEKMEKIFHSIGEVYQYKRDRLPDRDPDERMKLAQWCLTNHLTTEAKEQVQAVLAFSPKHLQAQRMMSFMEAADDRARFRDPAVRRAGAEVVEGPVDPAVHRAAPLEFAGVGLPTIFDLPTPLAVKRAEEFNRNVHPILQMHCARCHNERYAGSFQLIQVRTKHDLTPTVFRANLEATLRLIDPESPARSELLSSALVPHGGGPSKRPIFGGPKDPSYQRISAWVNSLRVPRSRDEATPARFAAPTPAGGESEAFAAHRGGRTPEGQGDRVPLPFTPTPVQPGARPVPVTATGPDEVIPQPPGQSLPGSGSGMQPDAPPNAEFPAPYLLGGPKPKLESTPGAGRENVPMPNATIPTPGTPSAAPEPPADAETAAPKKPKTPVKLDPALLEKALMNRYSPH
jgi:hypothetical protein